MMWWMKWPPASGISITGRLRTSRGHTPSSWRRRKRPRRKMIRGDFVRRWVLTSISDDFENVDQVILREVAETGAKCGLTIDRSEVVQALADLIEDGLAKAYI